MFEKQPNKQQEKVPPQPRGGAKIPPTETESIISQAIEVVEKVFDTLGPNGKRVVYQSAEGIGASKDGVTILKHLWHYDENVDNAIELIRQGSEKTLQEEGDGTTTTAMLACILYGIITDKAFAEIPHHQKVKIVEDSEKAILEELEVMMLPCDTEEALIKIATISANNDAEIGQHIGSLVSKYRENSFMMINKGRNPKTIVEEMKGVYLDCSIHSDYFLDDGPAINRPQSVLLMLNEAVGSSKGIIEDCAEYCIDRGIKSMILMCESVEPTILEVFKEYAQTGFDIVPIGLPDHGELRHQKMEDLASVTGGTYFRSGKGKSTDPADCLGEIAYAKILKYEVVLSLLDSAVPKVKSRTKYLNEKLAEIEKSDIVNRDFAIDNMKERISLINSSTCTIIVGGRTPAEVSEKYDRYDDAKRATISALQNGLVVTSSQALHQVSDELILRKGNSDLEDAIYNALIKPFEYVTKDLYVEFRPLKGEALNIITDTLGEPLEVGAIDPYAVVRSCVKNGFSVAKMLMSISSFVKLKPHRR